MITRRTPLKRSALKRKPTKKRKGDDPEYRDWLKTWPCYVCYVKAMRRGQVLGFTSRERELFNYYGGNWPPAVAELSKCRPVDVAHVGVRGRGQKCPDREAMPLGAWHHREKSALGGGPESHHTLGKKFFSAHGLDREEVISTLNRLYHEETGK